MPATKPDKIPRSNSSISYRWCRMFQAHLNSIASDPDMPKSAYKAFLGLLAIMDFDNEADITQTALAKHINVHRPEVTKALSYLERKEIITRLKKDNGRVVYQINERYALKGDIRPARIAR